MIASGNHLGDYLLLRKIAQGGMGEIYLACRKHDAKAERLFVLKVLRAELSADESFVAMLTDEANVVRNLDHPNIVAFHDFGEDGGIYFLVLEYIHGGPLQDVLAAHQRQGQTLDLAVSLFIAGRLTEALAYAHAANGSDGTPLKLIHRDVTPSNILISREGIVKLTDFGLVRAKGRMTETMPGILKGRFGYMAPEVMKYEEIDARADVFAAGVLLYEMLAGSGPIPDKSISDFVTVMESKSYSKPSALNSHVPAQLDDIVLKALEPAPKDRWQSASELSAALEDLVETWSKSWADVTSGQSRLKHLMLLLNSDLSSPAISQADLDSMIRSASAADMLEEGVLDSKSDVWTETTENDATLVRAISSPALADALNEMVAAPQLLTDPLSASTSAEDSEDETMSGRADDVCASIPVKPTPVRSSVPVASGHVFQAGKIDVRASRMSIAAVRPSQLPGGTAETVESIRAVDESSLIQEEALHQKEHLAAIRDELSISKAPQFDGWDISFHSCFMPSRGGDILLDVERPQGDSGIAFLQVVDAEPPPGLFTVHVVSTIRACLAQCASPASGVAWSNRLLVRPGVNRRESVSACYFQFDSNKAQLHYVNAAYPPPFFYQSKEKKLFSLAGSNQGLGAVEGGQFDHRKVPVASGDIVLIVTTGLLEAKNSKKELFGWQRAQDILLASVSKSASEIVKIVSNAVTAHTEGVEPARDWAVVVLKRS